MNYEESHHPPPQAVISFTKGGHPTAPEMVIGGLLMIAGLTIFYTWVATFDAIYSLGLIPFAIGAILMFHADPLMETFRKWRTPKGAPPATRSSAESH